MFITNIITESYQTMIALQNLFYSSILKFFKKDCPVFTSKTDMPEKIWEGVKNTTDILFVFPLYADGIPVSLI